MGGKDETYFRDNEVRYLDLFRNGLEINEFFDTKTVI